MPLKATYQASGYQKIDRWEGGVGWIAHPEETMQRASHILATDENVWIVDPVDAPGIDDLVSEYGEVAGVVVTMNRHRRDAAAIANRHDVPVYLPAWVTVDIDAPTRKFGEGLADTNFRTVKVLDVPGWKEAALYDESTGTLVVGEALGTVSYFLTQKERLGVHPMLRLFPPRAFEGLKPRRIVVGHGPGIFNDASGALRDAIEHSRARTPRLLVENLRAL